MDNKKEAEMVTKGMGETATPETVIPTEVKDKSEQATAGPKTVNEKVLAQTSTTVQPRDKGKMIMEDPETVDITAIKPTDLTKVLEVKVYRKWTSRNVSNPNPTGLCFILLDRRVSQSATISY